MLIKALTFGQHELMRHFLLIFSKYFNLNMNKKPNINAHQKLLSQFNLAIFIFSGGIFNIRS